MYEAVIFDVDGTIVDTRYIVDAVAEAFYQLHGRRLTKKDREFIYGATQKATLSFLNITPGEMPRFAEIFNYYMEQFIHRQRLFPGIWEVMSALKGQGCILGINTSRTKEEVDIVVKTTGVDFPALCSYCITCNMLSAPKPDPESLLLFSKLSGIPAENILFVGDSAFDQGCAQNAGCDFALATWGATQEISAKYYPKTPGEILNIFMENRG